MVLETKTWPDHEACWHREQETSGAGIRRPRVNLCPCPHHRDEPSQQGGEDVPTIKKNAIAAIDAWYGGTPFNADGSLPIITNANVYAYRSGCVLSLSAGDYRFGIVHIGAGFK
jgi:hypothetical protein